MEKNNKMLIAVVVVVLVVAAVWLIAGKTDQGGTVMPTAGTGTPGTVATPAGGTPAGTAPLGTNTPPGAGVPTSPNVSYLVLSPKLGDQWVLEQPHLISWNKPAGVTGAVYLVDAFTNTITGWINSGTGEKATSTSWDTKHLALTRNGGPQKIVGRGTYFIKVTFDRSQGSIRSNAFSLITPDEVTHNTFQVSLDQLALSPTTVTGKKGDTVVFVNDDDTITYQIASPDIFGPFKLMPGQSAALVLDLKPGTYPYSDQSHTGITGKIVVVP